MDDIEIIDVNIWDDYCEDGYETEEDKQETYLYVENSDISLDFQQKILQHLLVFINKNITLRNLLKNVQFELYFYDSTKIYPNLNSEEYEYLHFKRWKINIVGLSHKKRYIFLEFLQKYNLTYNNIPFHFYSES